MCVNKCAPHKCVSFPNRTDRIFLSDVIKWRPLPVGRTKRNHTSTHAHAFATAAVVHQSPFRKLCHLHAHAHAHTHPAPSWKKKPLCCATIAADMWCIARSSRARPGSTPCGVRTKEIRPAAAYARIKHSRKCMRGPFGRTHPRQTTSRRARARARSLTCERAHTYRAYVLGNVARARLFMYKEFPFIYPGRQLCCCLRKHYCFDSGIVNTPHPRQSPEEYVARCMRRGGGMVIYSLTLARWGGGRGGGRSGTRACLCGFEYVKNDILAVPFHFAEH